MTVVAAALAVGLLVAAVASVLVLRFVPTLRLQLGALALVAVCLPLGVVIASGLVMFEMDAAKVVSVAIASGVAALAGTLFPYTTLFRSRKSVV